MNKLINCKACQHEVAKMAKTCPSCGVKNPGMTGKDYLLSLVLFILLVLAIGYWVG
jgi:Zn finger protein HypA/HybF involved in hydrogenase expression